MICVYCKKENTIDETNIHPECWNAKNKARMNKLKEKMFGTADSTDIPLPRDSSTPTLPDWMINDPS